MGEEYTSYQRVPLVKDEDVGLRECEVGGVEVILGGHERKVGGDGEHGALRLSVEAGIGPVGLLHTSQREGPRGAKVARYIELRYTKARGRHGECASRRAVRKPQRENAEQGKTRQYIHW